VSENRQRWRLVFRRDEDARYLSHLDAVHLWERAFRRASVPVATSEGFSPRPRLIFAAPLSLGTLAEHELADLYLSEKVTVSRMRALLGEGIPRGYVLVDLYDVWLGAPALAPQLTAADYRLTLFNVQRQALSAAADALLTETELVRVRVREAKTTKYDLRPLVLELRLVEVDAAPESETATVWMRLRHSQNQGSGRPDEVAAALAELMGRRLFSIGADQDAATVADEPGGQLDLAPPLDRGARPRQADTDEIEITRQVRERLWMAGELALP
jgi:radical SAM-linked protein